MIKKKRYQITGRYEECDLWTDSLDDVKKECVYQYLKHKKNIMCWEHIDGKVAFMDMSDSVLEEISGTELTKENNNKR